MTSKDDDEQPPLRLRVHLMLNEVPQKKLPNNMTANKDFDLPLNDDDDKDGDDHDQTRAKVLKKFCITRPRRGRGRSGINAAEGGGGSHTLPSILRTR